MTSTHDNEADTDKASRTRHLIRNLNELFWTEYPGHHHQALSKAIVTPELSGSKFFDHRISCYEPGAFVESHVHKVQEQIYHFLSGEGVLITDGERRVVCGNDVAFIPPGVVHELHCTGTETLVFLVITTPPTDD